MGIPMPWNDDWMTAKECADWWRDLTRSGVDKGYGGLERAGLGADTAVGFTITWGAGSLATAADMFLFDPLRIGDGTGNAVGDTRPGAGNTLMRGLGVLADIGRATVFLPLGRVTRLGRVAATEEQAVARTLPGAIKPPTPITSGAKPPTRVGMPAGEAPFIEPDPQGLSTCSKILQKIFSVAPDVAPRSGICSWMALTQALRSTGRWYIRIEDIARLFGFPAMPFSARTVAKFENMFVASVRDYSMILARLKITAVELDLAVVRPWARICMAASRAAGKRVGPEINEVLQAAFSMQKGKGVILFPVEWAMRIEGKMTNVGHMLYARLDDAGKVVIFDRSGATVRLLSELEALYPGIGQAHFLEAAMDRAANMRPGLLFIEDAVAAESRAAMAKAVQQTANNAHTAVPSGGLFGPIAIPIKLHLHLPNTPLVVPP